MPISDSPARCASLNAVANTSATEGVSEDIDTVSYQVSASKPAAAGKTLSLFATALGHTVPGITSDGSLLLVQLLHPDVPH